ncbi:kinase-like protein, partial [Rhizodiscina lignyota]
MAFSTESVAINPSMVAYGSYGPTGNSAQNRPVWWTEERIQSTVTMEYVAGRLKDNERSHLHRPLAFGDGLTSDTYLEFIMERAKTLFLILAEIGVPNRIFSIIDRSYDDGDLPIPLDIVEDLALNSKGDEKLDKKFHAKQFEFLLRELDEGEHIDYAPQEAVAMEYSYRQPSAQCLQNWVRIRVPRRASGMLARRHIAMERPDISEGFPDDYYDDIDTMKSVHHDHIVPIWASYTFKGAGYVLTPFIADHTLKSFFESGKVQSFQQLSKTARQRLLLEWMHCLAEAVAYLHLNGFQHTAIRPSNIVIDQDNKIAFSEIGSLKSFQRDKKIDPTEVYNYGAPEAHLGERYVFMNSSANKSVGTSSTSDDSFETSSYAPSSSDSGGRRTAQLSNTWNFSSLNNSLAQIPASPVTDARSTYSSSSQSPTEKTDIFSLGCIFLEILSCLHKFKPTDISKHVRSPRKTQKGNLTARFDCSYHANIPRVNTWLNQVEDRAFDQDDRLFRSIPHILRLVRAMLNHDPELRPTAVGVRDHVYSILTHYAGLESESLHCGS